jgi:hypothetical protein
MLAGTFSFPAALMLSGTVADLDSVMPVHRFGIGDGQDDRGPHPATRPDCTKPMSLGLTRGK